MSEYIEKQKALDILVELSVLDPMWVAIRHLPAADVDPIIHCADCRHLYFKDMLAYYCPHMVGPCRPKGYCWRAEGREIS